MTNSSTSLQSKLSLNVYVTPMRPMVGTPPQGPGDEPMWSPMSSTLIYGERDAILVDTLVTFDQVDALQTGLKVSKSVSPRFSLHMAIPTIGLAFSNFLSISLG